MDAMFLGFQCKIEVIQFLGKKEPIDRPLRQGDLKREIG
jgi:hypothetical protein